MISADFIKSVPQSNVIDALLTGESRSRGLPGGSRGPDALLFELASHACGEGAAETF